MKKTNDEPIKNVLKAFVSSYKHKRKLDQTRIKAIWNKMMGPSIEKYTTKIQLNNKRLFITISSSVLRQELSYGKEKIIDMLNEELGETAIHEVIFY